MSLSTQDPFQLTAGSPRSTDRAASDNLMQTDERPFPACQQWGRRVKVMTFREFLEKQAQHSRHKQRRERREEWIAAVGRLIEQLRAWIAQSDPAGVVDVLP